MRAILKLLKCDNCGREKMMNRLKEAQVCSECNEGFLMEVKEVKNAK